MPTRSSRDRPRRKAHLRPSGLTQIEMRKLELARAMAARPKLLISDEAMAGCQHRGGRDPGHPLPLNTQGITIIMIEHIMRAVMRFSERIVVLDAGEQDRRGHARRGRPQPRRGEGLPWRVGSPSRDVDAGYGAVRVLHGVSIEVRDGETVALLGTNGNGKSTLIKCIMGMVRPDAGEVVLEIDGDADRPDSARPPRRS